MKTYYTQKRAQSYNQRWKVFSTKTHAAVFSAIDFTQVNKIYENSKRPLRILDAACGTGLLLERLSHLMPYAELYGVDESEGMLAQARLFLPAAHFVHTSLQGTKKAGLPYETASFDLITCTNALHNVNEPVGVLRGLRELLVPQGHFVLEDYARRGFPFPWRLFEWFTRRIDPQHVRAYTLSEAQLFCQEAGLRVIVAHNFPIDTVWRGWVIRADAPQFQ
jgi:ubiquinone/menaquinone biosynthesis C-methylase UbiE